MKSPSVPLPPGHKPTTEVNGLAESLTVSSQELLDAEVSIRRPGLSADDTQQSLKASADGMGRGTAEFGKSPEYKNPVQLGHGLA